MTRNYCKARLLQIGHWLNTPTRAAAQPATLRWWVTANNFDRYFSRMVMLLTLTSAIYLFGCNSAASSGREYIGTWEHTTTSTNVLFTNPHKTSLATNFDILTITQDGDHFLITRTKKLDDGFGNIVSQGTHTYLGTLKDGILEIHELDAGFAKPYTYVKATDTLITHGSEHDIEYHRSKP